MSRSSTEAEYKALANAASELAWVQNLLCELGVPSSCPPTLYCDNTGATYSCANPIYHSRMKHVALDYHFVRELVTSGRLRTVFIPSKLKVADIFTKSLPRSQFEFFRDQLCIRPPPCRLRGDFNIP